MFGESVTMYIIVLYVLVGFAALLYVPVRCAPPSAQRCFPAPIFTDITRKSATNPSLGKNRRNKAMFLQDRVGRPILL